MATPAVEKGVQFIPAEYSIFWQSWPQFENANGEHRQVGIELELIGAHASDLNHIDPFSPARRGETSGKVCQNHGCGAGNTVCSVKPKL